jgi:hypothetical protein
VMKTHHVPPRGDHADSEYPRLDLAVIHL